MEYCLDENCAGSAFTPKDRNAIIQYCLSVATRGKCSTQALLRPFKQKYLTEAFREQSEKHRSMIAKFEQDIKEYDPETTVLPQWLLEFFEGIPTKEEYADYFTKVIKQEREVFRTLKYNYSVYVDYAFLGKDLLDFHNSLNPRVTFGYSNSLHEECDFAFDEEKRQAFLHTSHAKNPQSDEDWSDDWGIIGFEGASLVYEDLQLYRGEECILETVSHEQMMTVRLEKDDIHALALKHNGSKLVKKLSRAAQFSSL